MALGSQVRELREGAGWSRATLAAKAKVSYATVARTELYGHVPTVRILSDLAAALDTTVAVLLGDDEPTKAAS